jgi:hypothetical protein
MVMCRQPRTLDQSRPPQWPQSLSFLFSCPLNRRPENIIVEAIIVPKLELRNVKMQVSFADIVKRAYDPALEDAPETLNRVRMNCADYVLALGVVNGDMLRETLIEVFVANPLDLCRAS